MTIKLTKDHLHTLYWDENLSLNQIANIFNRSKSTIVGWMDKFEIKRKPINKANNTKKRRNWKISKEKLQKYYIENRLSTVAISKKYNIDPTTVSRKLKKFNIPIRKGSESFTKHSKERIAFFHKGKKVSTETREKLSKSFKGKKQPKWIVEKRAASLRGEKNPLWKGTRSLYEKIRKSYYMKQWKTQVFERDNYTCQFCKDDKGGNLNDDHVIPFSYILKEGKIKTFEQAIKYKKLWDINNGRTLCVECHKKTDTYGEKAKNYTQENQRE